MSSNRTGQPATTAMRLTVDLSGYDERALRQACVIVHTAAVTMSNIRTGDLCLAIAAELDEARSARRRDYAALSADLDDEDTVYGGSDDE